MKRFLFMGLALALACASIKPVSAQVIGTQYLTAASVAGACNAGACAIFSVGNQPSITLQISGTFSETIAFESTSDGNTWVSTSFMNLASGSLATSTTSGGQFSVANTGLLSVRARVTVWSSGQAAVVATTGSTRQSLVSSGGGGGGSGTVTSVDAQFSGGLVTSSGGPVTNSGTITFNVAGTSGGVPCFNSASTWTSSAALGANLPLIGGGAGACVGAGTRQGNTTKFVTFAGSAPATSDCAQFDASGNLATAGGPCASSGANPALSNLSLVSINTSLLAQSGVDLGSTTKPFRSLFLYGTGTYGTNYFNFTGAPTSTRTVTIPDATGTMGVLSGSFSANDCLKYSSGLIISAGAACGSGGGSGTVTSVAQSFTGGLISVAGSPITTSGTLALTVAGTSGGIPYFSSGSTWATSSALTASLPVIGGGPGVAPTVGSRSGNTTQFVTTGGTQTSGDCVSIDGNGNHIAQGTPCGSSTQTYETRTSSVTLSKDVTYCDPTSSSVTLALPSVSTFSGRTFYVKQITSAANPCTVSGTIDGVTNDILGGIGYGTSYYSNGTTWNAKTFVTPPVTATDGQLLIGDTATGKFDQATLTAGTGMTVTNAAGGITVATTAQLNAFTSIPVSGQTTVTASGSTALTFVASTGMTITTNNSTKTVTFASSGGGAGCSTSGSATQVLTDNGSTGCTSNAGFLYTGGLATLGVASTTIGKIKLFGNTSGDLTLAPTAAAGTASVATFPARSGTVAYETGSTFTTGTISLPFPVLLVAAVCQNATASLSASTATTLAPTAVCESGTAGSATATAYGAANFVFSEVDEQVYHFPLPADWTSTGGLDVQIKWRAISTTANDVRFQISTKCVGTGTASTAVSFNSAQSTVAVTNLTTTLQWNSSSLTGATLTGCSAGNELFIKVSRDTSVSGDTLDADVQIMSIIPTVRRAVTIGG